MKDKNIFKINVVVNIYGEKSLVTVEEPFTVKKLREELDIPDSWKLLCSWVPAVNDCVLEDWDVVEVRYDLKTVLNKMEKEIGEMRTIMTDLGYIK